MEAERELRTSIVSGSYNQPPATRSFRMAVVSGPSVGANRAIEAREFRIGKASANDLALSDPTVSRFHCVIESTPHGLMLRDLGSTNGTQVGGCFVERAYLTPLVPIQIGSSTLQVMSVLAESNPSSDATQDVRLLGTSPAVRQLLGVLPKVANAGATVLLEGETGTGKTLLAEMIHRSGPHPEGPFIIVDCGTIPPNLIESELFGHERGSFTGATERQIGAFEAAHGGTVFLDEIGELPLHMQPKLLRVLEERMIKRVGSTKSVQIDVRVVAATNRDLKEGVELGSFRADLFYRLDALRLRLPPLRERREDIPPLIEQFAKRARADLDPALLEGIKRTLSKRKDWPGNIRELRNAVEKAILLGDFDPGLGTPPSEPSSAGAALLDDSTEFDLGVSFRDAKDRAVADWERMYLRSLIKHAGWNLSLAARLGQMDRSHLRELLRRHQIDP
ncbi:MAG TPA: sigma 54-interacting transcriptional regulator [Polyangia bacterium]|nr:sigma 54-interacting transcriptional regulator [Polyangia bacterium]